MCLTNDRVTKRRRRFTVTEAMLRKLNSMVNNITVKYLIQIGMFPIV